MFRIYPPLLCTSEQVKLHAETARMNISWMATPAKYIFNMAWKSASRGLEGQIPRAHIRHDLVHEKNTPNRLGQYQMPRNEFLHTLLTGVGHTQPNSAWAVIPNRVTSHHNLKCSGPDIMLIVVFVLPVKMSRGSQTCKALSQQPDLYNIIAIVAMRSPE